MTTKGRYTNGNRYYDNVDDDNDPQMRVWVGKGVVDGGVGYVGVFVDWGQFDVRVVVVGGGGGGCSSGGE